jgi:hypothetical protein
MPEGHVTEGIAQALGNSSNVGNTGIDGSNVAVDATAELFDTELVFVFADEELLRFELCPDDCVWLAVLLVEFRLTHCSSFSVNPGPHADEEPDDCV